MRFLSAAVSDQGNVRKTNQDSVLIKIAEFESYGQIAMAVMCDGMGGYSKGELASATLVRSLAEWFDNKLPAILPSINSDSIITEWTEILSENNTRIRDYGEAHHIKLGTTFSGILLFNNEYIFMHIGDSRIYKVENVVTQLTEDHSFVAREVKRGNLSEEEARNHPRRNVLLQCVGLSKELQLHIGRGNVLENDLFLLCSDGLYHTFSKEEFNKDVIAADTRNVGKMRKLCKTLIDKAITNGEKDNLSIILLKGIEQKKSIFEEYGLVQEIELIHTDEEIR